VRCLLPVGSLLPVGRLLLTGGCPGPWNVAFVAPLHTVLIAHVPKPSRAGVSPRRLWVVPTPHDRTLTPWPAIPDRPGRPTAAHVRPRRLGNARPQRCTAPSPHESVRHDGAGSRSVMTAG